MLPSQKKPDPVSSPADEPALSPPTDRVKDFIAVRLARGEQPERIAAGLRAHFEIEIAPAAVIPWWQAERTSATQTERRQDKESVQFPEDEVKEPLSIAPEWDPASDPVSDAGPDPASAGAPEEETQTTQTGPRQNQNSLQLPVDMVDEPMARDKGLQALADLAMARHGLARPAATTQTGRRQNPETHSALTEEVKAFIVRGLARYETPTRVAAAVKVNFDIEIDRRQVFAYDPAGSRPPAQRWIELHATTRAKFMDAMGEIGIANKLVRLRMLERYAHRADEHNQMERAAAFLDQAAKECGGFYERFQRPKSAEPPAA
jgi:hypothetical protein